MSKKKQAGETGEAAIEPEPAEAEPEGRLTEAAIETEDAAPERAATQADIAPAAAPRAARTGLELPRHWPATLLVLVVAAFLVGGLAAYWPQLTGTGEGERLAALEARIETLTAGQQAPAAGNVQALQRRLESAEARVGTLERNAPTIFNEQAGATLDGRVTALEQGRTETAQAQAALIARLSTIEAATPADLPQRLQSFALSSNMALLESRVTQLEALRQAASVLALARLARAADEARPFLREFRALQTVAPEDPAIPVLEPYAESGIATEALLAARFPEAARTAINAERAGLADGFWGRLWARFRNLVSIRRIAMGDGDDTESRLARAQALLGAGDLEAAVEETAALTGDAGIAIAPWLREARARLAMDRAIAEMDERLIQVLAVGQPSANPAPAVAAPPAPPANPAPATP